MSTKALTFYGTTIGKKAVMAVSGFMLLGFVLAHMAGNLQIFLGPAAINGYSEFLHSMPGVLWGARLFLLAMIVAHIASAVMLTRQNRAARPVAYRRKANDLATSYAARVMPYTGLVLLLFIVYHLLHLTVGVVGPEFTHLKPYENVVAGFSIPWLAGFYIVAQLCLAFHLYHGAWSLFQTLGASHPRYNGLRKKAAVGLTAIIAIGNISIPVSVLAGWVS